MRSKVLTLFLIGCLALAGCAREEEPISALEIEAEMARIASAGTLWPDYDPLAIPLAVYDGTDTWLFRHPAPPEGFVERNGAQVFAGRHPAIVANSSAMIGEVATATLMIESMRERHDVTGMAGVAVHEAFHVFQRDTDRRWGANEASLFLFPVERADLLALRRMETEALRRAFLADEDDEVAGWARLALDVRGDRFGQMEAEFPAYERGTEVGEGTPTYVEYRATGRTDPELPEGGFDATNVRARSYQTGVAFAFLLDRYDPGWRDGFGDDEERFPDVDLARALPEIPETVRRAFTAEEKDEFARIAGEDVEALMAERDRRKQEFESAPGWRLIVEAPLSQRLWLRGFDPMNVDRIEGGLIHRRYLSLGNDAGTIDVMGDTVLTEGPGPHPLYNGVTRVVLTGLAGEPALEVSGGHVALELPAFKLDIEGATVEKSGERAYVRIDPAVE
jgi:hypothetical protein